MSEVPLYHKLQGLSCASGVPRHHGVTGHNLTDCGGVGVNTLSCDLSEYVNLRTTRKQCFWHARGMPDPWQ